MHAVIADKTACPACEGGMIMTTDLHHAVRDGDAARIAELTLAGADPNARDEDGWTPLDRARAGLDKAAGIVSQMEAATVRQEEEDDTPGLLRLKPSQLASLAQGAGWVVIVLLGGIGISGILG